MRASKTKNAANGVGGEFQDDNRDHNDNNNAQKSKTQPPAAVFAVAVDEAVKAYAAAGKTVDAALAYAKFGVPCFPLAQAKTPIPKRDPDPSGKFKDGIPGTGGLYKATTDRQTIVEWWRKNPQALIAVPMGQRTGVWVLDVDAPGDHEDGVGALEKLCAERGALPDTRRHASGTGGVHYFFTWTESAPIRCSRGVIPKGIDIKGTGGYVVVPPSVRKKKGPYVVASDVPIVDPPGWLIEAIFEKKPRPKKEPEEVREHRGDVDEKTVAKAMEFVANDNAPWDFWNTIGMSLFAWSPDEKSFALFDKWSKTSAKYDGDETRARWGHYEASPPTRLTIGTIFHHARLGGWKPTIFITPEISRMVELAQEALIGAGVPIYQRGGMLVRPVVDEIKATHGRNTKVARLREIDVAYLRVLMDRHAVWLKKDVRSNKWSRSTPSKDYAEAMLSLGGDGWKFSVVSGVTTTPTMRPDGSLLVEEGYDEATKLLLLAPPPLPAMPATPTRDDAMAALTTLKELLAGFYFRDDVSRAIALSAILTPILRGAIDVAPLHVATAPAAGSGKSFLFDCVSYIAIGYAMPATAPGRDEEEMEKRLGGSLIAGDTLICLDNLTAPLKGVFLCQAIERRIVDIRPLGRSDKIKVESGSTLYATGNNVVMVGDVCRRALMLTIDTQQERPETLQYKFDPAAMILADRGKFIAAALTIVRAYVVAGKPRQVDRLGSFGEWSDLVRSALVWLGEEDCVKSMDTTGAEDPEKIALRAMLNAMEKFFGVGFAHHYTLQKVIETSAHAEELSDALKLAIGDSGESNRLAYWARRKKGAVIDGKRLANKPDAKGIGQWFVERLDGVEEGPTATVAETTTAGETTTTTGPTDLPKGWTGTLTMETETKLAVLFKESPEWFPKSKITTMEPKGGDVYAVTMSLNLAKEKGLMGGRPKRQDAPF